MQMLSLGLGWFAEKYPMKNHQGIRHRQKAPGHTDAGEHPPEVPWGGKGEQGFVGQFLAEKAIERGNSRHRQRRDAYQRPGHR
jgi:hypothetical protein